MAGRQPAGTQGRAACGGSRSTRAWHRPIDDEATRRGCFSQLSRLGDLRCGAADEAEATRSWLQSAKSLLTATLVGCGWLGKTGGGGVGMSGPPLRPGLLVVAQPA